MGFTAFGGAAFCVVVLFEIRPVDRFPLAFSVLPIEAKDLVKHILPDIGGQEAVHGNEISFLSIKRAPIAKKSLCPFDFLKALQLVLITRFFGFQFE
ncbi:MAG: hypothetical protein K2K53_06555 [Oscillospiraceae bacterium]|nr:hypothetical protein [Oscillospiraceae bacterium]